MTVSSLLRSLALAGLALGLVAAPLNVRARTTSATYVNPASLPGPEFSINSSLALWSPSVEYQAADDFRVPLGNTWWFVNQVHVKGKYSIATSLVHAVVEFYYDDGTNLPGSLHSRQVIPAANLVDASGVLTIPIATMAFAPGKRYWVSVQPLIPNVTNSVWFWQVGTPTNPGPAGNGYASVHYNSTVGGACMRWTSRASGGGQNCGDPPAWGITYIELAFELNYTEFTPSHFIYLPVARR